MYIAQDLSSDAVAADLRSLRRDPEGACVPAILYIAAAVDLAGIPHDPAGREVVSFSRMAVGGDGP